MNYIISIILLLLVVRGWWGYIKSRKIEKNNIQYPSPNNGYYLRGEEFIHCDKCGKMRKHSVFSNRPQSTSDNQDFTELQYFVCCNCNKS